jgi:hypothetical protein
MAPRRLGGRKQQATRQQVVGDGMHLLARAQHGGTSSPAAPMAGTSIAEDPGHLLGNARLFRDIKNSYWH